MGGSLLRIWRCRCRICNDRFTAVRVDACGGLQRVDPVRFFLCPVVGGQQRRHRCCRRLGGAVVVETLVDRSDDVVLAYLLRALGEQDVIRVGPIADHRFEDAFPFLEGRDKWIRIGEPKATGEGAVASALEASEAWINARKLSAVWW